MTGAAVAAGESNAGLASFEDEQPIAGEEARAGERPLLVITVWVGNLARSRRARSTFSKFDVWIFGPRRVCVCVCVPCVLARASARPPLKRARAVRPAMMMQQPMAQAQPVMQQPQPMNVQVPQG